MYFGQVNVEEMHCGSVYGIMERAAVACFNDLLVLCFMVDVGLWLRGISVVLQLPASLSRGSSLLVSSSS